MTQGWGKCLGRQATEGMDEEVIVAARVPWKEGAQGEGEEMTWRGNGG